MPEGSRYARRAPPPDPEDEEQGAAEGPPQDPGEAAIDGLAGTQAMVLLFVPLVAAIFVVERLHGGRPRAGWVLGHLASIGALTLWALLVEGLGHRREWARRALLGLAPLLSLAAICALAALGAPWPAVAVLGALAVGVALSVVRKLRLPEVRAAFARGPQPTPDGAGLLAAWAAWSAFFTLFVLLDWLQLELRRETGALLSGTLAGLATVLGALAGAGLIVGAVIALRELRRQARSDPALTAPATRARLLALRAQGLSLRQLAHALEAEGHPPPGGGRWTGRTLRGVLRLEPRRRRAAPG